jgi:hypothetical protein
MKEIPTVWFDRPAGYDRRVAQVQEPDQPCIHCGRALKPDARVMVEVHVGGGLIPPGHPDSGGRWSQGCFPIGLTCLRKCVGPDWRTWIRGERRSRR